MDKLGLDLGTKHIVLSWREESGQIRSKYEVNGYISIKKDDQFTEQLLIKNKVPFVPHGDNIIAIGSKAEKLAYMFNNTLCRPMAEGGVSKEDDYAQEIMAIIVKSIIESAIGKIADNTILYYCTTAAAVNSNKMNEDAIKFHKKIVQLVVEKYVGKNKIKAHHINEARCLIVDKDDCPAIGISWGAGTVTVHAGFMGFPIFEFCITGAGDFIDIEAAKRFGYDPEKPDRSYKETPTTIAHAKHKIDLSVEPEPGSVNQAIKIMYEILVENVVYNIVKGFNDNKDKCRFPQPVTIVNAGGTSMPAGFMDLFKYKLNAVKDKLSIPIGDIEHSKDPLFAVSRGCLSAAELHQDG